MKPLNLSRTAMFATAALAGVIGIPTATAQIDAAVNYFVGVQPDGAAVADLNGDGIPDIAATADQTAALDNVAILFGAVDGTFGAPVYVLLPNSSSPGDIVAGDLDGDGDIDLAVALRDFNQVISVINNGAGSFTLGAAAPTGVEPRGMDIGDADVDGDLDIVVGNRESSSVTFLLNVGADEPGFSSTTMPSGEDVRGATWGDFDEDGDLDAAVSSHDDRTVRVFRNDGGTFSAAATLSVGPNDRPSGITAADLDGDGDDDIATTSSDDGAVALNRVVVFFANSASSFTGPFYVPTGGLNTDYVAAADLDCDGDIDLATANELSNNISMMLNLGGGTFGAPTLSAAGSNPNAIVAGDIQADGDSDLVAVNRNSDNVSVYLSHCDNGKPGAPEDLDGDGVVGFGDLLILLSEWGACAGCPSDLDGSGDVGFGDLLLLLNAWSV